ncbi:MAG: hypothetical protein EOP06_00460 [Proteobacteria bacterium]|nr:MAG: hypothetical protein EOP06_00460 [Pseudomonadota bacterium]
MFNPSRLTPAEQVEYERLVSQFANDPGMKWLASMTDYQRKAWNVVFEERRRMTLVQWGRGTGKDYFGSQVIKEIVTSNEGLEIILTAPVIADIRDVMINGSSGLMQAFADFPEAQKPKYISSQGRVDFINNNYALLIPASEPERFRGKNATFAWLDELGSYRKKESYTNLKLALRQPFSDGTAPQMLITTTPQPSTLMRELTEKIGVDNILRAATFDNPYLHKDVLQDYIDEFGGTTLGKQELYGELLDDVAGALWNIEQVTECALTTPTNIEMKWVGLGIDPAGDGAASDLTGLVVVGLGADGIYYVLADYTDRYSPEALYNKVEDIFDDTTLNVDGGWVETNYGGSFLKASLPSHRGLVFKPSSRGKDRRAIPTVQLYERGLVKHNPGLAELEKQMYTWSPIDKTAKSPDRVDAMVFAYSWLLERNRKKIRVW